MAHGLRALAICIILMTVRQWKPRIDNHLANTYAKKLHCFGNRQNELASSHLQNLWKEGSNRQIHKTCVRCLEFTSFDVEGFLQIVSGCLLSATRLWLRITCRSNKQYLECQGSSTLLMTSANLKTPSISSKKKGRAICNMYVITWLMECWQN
jgi:hypothetical protein